MQRFYWKRQLVIDWLVTCRFSSLDILSALTGLESKDNAFFFKRLIETKVIVRFKNKMHSKKDLVRLGPVGWGIHSWGDLPATNIRSDVFENHQRVEHDLMLQRVLLKVFANASEIHVSYDRNHQDLQDARPDALLFADFCEGKPACVELEYTRKNHQKIYQRFNQYRKKINEDAYGFVVFYFTNKAMCETYRELFDAEFWPTWSKKRNKQGKEYWSRNDHKTHYPASEVFRSRFMFEFVENPMDIVLNTSKTFEVPDESQLDRWYERKERSKWEAKKEAEHLNTIAPDQRQGAVSKVEEDEPDDDGNDCMHHSKPETIEQKPAKKGFWSRMLG